MRVFFSAISGNAIDTATFLLNRNLPLRTTIIGIPLISLILFTFFFFTGESIIDVANHAISRNQEMRAKAMSLALEQILEETRNQLRILASGSMDRDVMVKRLGIRSQTNDLPIREVAYTGITLQTRYVLLNYGGGIIALPSTAEANTASNPFQSMATDLPRDAVSVGQPQEVGYTLVPVGDKMQNLTFYVLRFSTAVYDENGNQAGFLLLSLDLTALRDKLSLLSSESSALSSGDAGIRSMFFDHNGWILFQSEDAADEKYRDYPLRSDDIRAGLNGDIGRPAFSLAFRPSSQNRGYWSMVESVKERKSGHITLDEPGEKWFTGYTRAESVSYAPVTFHPGPDVPTVVVGGVGLLDTNFTRENYNLKILGSYALCFILCLTFLGLTIWFLVRGMSRRICAISDQISQRNARNGVDPLDLPPMPIELESLRASINALLGRLRRAKQKRASAVGERASRLLSEPAKGMPDPQSLKDRLLVGDSPAMGRLMGQIEKAAGVSADVLIIGETGTGKELVSRAIHMGSSRAGRPFIPINCGALDENLLMDTLFGHVKGAFTDAKENRKGAFLAAEGGTLMLDEIGNATPRVQQALLRALSIRQIRPLGSDQDIPFDTRIIAATNADLLKDGQDGSFRSDLYFRLAVIAIHTPPLRRRREDIPALVVHFMAQAMADGSNGVGRPMPAISRGALEKLSQHAWPGNVRELRNTILRALTFCHSDVLQAEDILIDAGDAAPPRPNAQGTSSPASGRSHPRFERNRKKSAAPAERAGADGENARSPAEAAHGDGGVATEEQLAGLNGRQLAMVEQIIDRGAMSRQEYQDIAGGIAMRTAQYDLTFMVQRGLVFREGRGPALRYRPAVRRLPQAAQSRRKKGERS
ncbi:MAG: sigma-54-dependent Fis family transcriptional regulator [Desulfovibrio sp.]|nr:sigma-54-dependent Fis family transcriptional regulator [Desulfovibrio sp.]